MPRLYKVWQKELSEWHSEAEFPALFSVSLGFGIGEGKAGMAAPTRVPISRHLGGCPGGESMGVPGSTGSNSAALFSLLYTLAVRETSLDAEVQTVLPLTPTTAHMTGNPIGLQPKGHQAQEVRAAPGAETRMWSEQEAVRTPHCQLHLRQGVTEEGILK